MVRLRSSPALARSLPFAFLLLFATATGHAQEDRPLYAARDGWTAFSGDSLNISSFVFRDLNRNRVYDLADRPMAGLGVEILKPDGDTFVSLSNIQGFANFPMSVLDREAVVTEPGDYRFRALVPDGWEITTGNGVQHGEFSIFPGAYADIVLPRPLSPVGLAPVLRIFGRVLAAPGQDAASFRAHAAAPSGARREVSLTAEGRFSFSAEPGEWRLEFEAPGSENRLERRVTVGNAPVQIADIVLDGDILLPASTPTLVDFDGITHADIAEMPSGAGEVGWSGMVTTDHTTYGGPGYVNVLQSGHYVGYNSSGHPAAIVNSRPFDFRGGYFGVAWARAEGEILDIRAWRGDRLVYRDEITLSSLGPVWFDADYRSVTRIDLTTRHYWQFVCDDLAFGVGGPWTAP